MAKKQTETGRASQEEIDEFCCLMNREARITPPTVKPPSPPPKPKPVITKLTAVKDCCGCGCSIEYYEDGDGYKLSVREAERLLDNGTAEVVGEREV